MIHLRDAFMSKKGLIVVDEIREFEGQPRIAFCQIAALERACGEGGTTYGAKPVRVKAWVQTE